MRRESFTCTGPLFADVITTSGDVEFLPGTDGEVVVELRGGPAEAYSVELNGSDLTVHPPTKRNGKRRLASTAIKVHVPADSSASIRTASGDISVLGPLSDVTVATASGDLRVQSDVRRDLDARTASGDLKLREVGGSLAVTTASGDLVAEVAGADLRFNSASGNSRVGLVGGTVEAKTVSGSVEVTKVEGQSVRVRTVSGEVRLGIPSGRTVDLDLKTMSGKFVNRIEKGAEHVGHRQSLAISMKSVSGDLRLQNG